MTHAVSGVSYACCGEFASGRGFWGYWTTAGVEHNPDRSVRLPPRRADFRSTLQIYAGKPAGFGVVLIYP